MQTTATTQTGRDSNALATLVDAYNCELAARREQLRHALTSIPTKSKTPRSATGHRRSSDNRSAGQGIR